MFCSHCGAQVADGQKFCVHCGHTLAQPQQSQPEPVAIAPTVPTAPTAEPQPVYQQPVQPAEPQPMYQQPVPPMYQPPMYAPPMKWHNFLIYFSLFAGAVLNFLVGILYLTGMYYMEDGVNYSELVYAMFDGLQIVDILMGIACFASAALCLYTRFRLAAFRANGPKWLMINYAFQAIVMLIYVIACSVVTEGLVNQFAGTGGTLVWSVVLIILNNIYYKKRDHLFVN